MSIRLSKPSIGDREECLARLGELLDTGYLVQGKWVGELEQQLAKYLSARHAIAVSSGTAALHVAVAALDIGPGDEVIVPAYTFPATANVIELVGAKPVFVDVELETFNIDLTKVPQAITDRTKALLPVHMFGNPLNMDALGRLATKHCLPVIEDAAGALGSAWKARACGTLGAMGCFSFHPRKLITTGEGGLVTTGSDELASKLRTLRNHGIVSGASGNDFVCAGFNYRLSEMPAVLGVRQMAKVESLVAERHELVKAYAAALEPIRDQVSMQQVPVGGTMCAQAFVVRLERAKATAVIPRLKERGIEANIGTYAVPLLSHYRKKYSYSEPDFPVAAQIMQHNLALPFYNGIPRQDIATVARELEAILT